MTPQALIVTSAVIVTPEDRHTHTHTDFLDWCPVDLLWVSQVFVTNTTTQQVDLWLLQNASDHTHTVIENMQINNHIPALAYSTSVFN